MGAVAWAVVAAEISNAVDGHTTWMRKEIKRSFLIAVSVYQS
jgi:hypothetical protein